MRCVLKHARWPMLSLLVESYYEELLALTTKSFQRRSSSSENIMRICSKFYLVSIMKNIYYGIPNKN